MGRGIGAAGRSEVLGRAGDWTVFCAPDDARPIHNISLQTDAGRAPLVPGYVRVGTTSRLVHGPQLSMRFVAERSALEALGMAEDSRMWRVLALCVVDDQAGEVYLGQYMPDVVVWSIVPRRDDKSVCDVAALAYLDRDLEYAYRLTFAGPGWLARLAEVRVEGSDG